MKHRFSAIEPRQEHQGTTSCTPHVGLPLARKAVTCGPDYGEGLPRAGGDSYDGHLDQRGRSTWGGGLLLAIVACTVLFTAATANAHFFSGNDLYLFSGNDLYRMCRGSIDEQEQCLGYMAGVSDGVDVTASGHGGKVLSSKH